ncbi:hypothetical protein [Streptomyces sp. NPDC053720]|uniref:hypothetical protein n=1 Tax=Streptomyces sp. NPDC053720 TaxID=3154855 RepID=UPI003432334E
MDAIQQHMIDSYRAVQRGELPPPLPGRHDWDVVREARERRRFDAVIAGRPARGRRRAALRSLLGKLGKPRESGRPGKPGKPEKLGKSEKCRPSGA